MKNPTPKKIKAKTRRVEAWAIVNKKTGKIKMDNLGVYIYQSPCIVVSIANKIVPCLITFPTQNGKNKR